MVLENRPRSRCASSAPWAPAPCGRTGSVQNNRAGSKPSRGLKQPLGRPNPPERRCRRLIMYARASPRITIRQVVACQQFGREITALAVSMFVFGNIIRREPSATTSDNMDRNNLKTNKLRTLCEVAFSEVLHRNNNCIVTRVTFHDAMFWSVVCFGAFRGCSPSVRLTHR